MARVVPQLDVARTLGEEPERWIFFAPVGVMTGIAFYFALPEEPWPFTGLLLLSIVTPMALLRHRWPLFRVAWLCLAFVAASLALVQLETW